MTDTSALSGSILTPNGWVKGHVIVSGNRIAAIEGTALQPGEVVGGPYILPGFIDLHVHGGGGADCLEGEDAARRMVRFHAGNGTVAILPTTSTAPIEITEGALKGITNVYERQEEQGAAVLGIHLEGPFISANRLGAQEARPLDGDPALAERWASTYPIRVATVAPEIPKGLDVVRALARHGCRVQVGHSIADDDELRAGFSAGCTGFTHLFNAMTPCDHKASGIAAYAMAYGNHAEIVSDLGHVHPTVVRAAYRAIPNLYAITDAVAVAGLEDGEHVTRGGRRTVVKSGTKVVLKNSPSTRAGSGITMIDAFRNLASIGIPLETVSAMTSTRAADYIGATDLGRIQPGFKASLVRLDHELRLDGVWVEGRPIAHI